MTQRFSADLAEQLPPYQEAFVQKGASYGGASSSAVAAASDESVTDPENEPRNRGRPRSSKRTPATPPKATQTIVKCQRGRPKGKARSKSRGAVGPDRPPPLPESFSVEDVDFVNKEKERPKRASSVTSPQKGQSRKRSKSAKALSDSEIETVAIRGVTATQAPRKTTETQAPKLAIEEPKITVLVLPKSKTPTPTPRPTPPAKPKPKAKAKATAVRKDDKVKKKPATVKQDDKVTKKQQSPSQVSLQVIRELFEDAKNKKAITATVYLEYADVWKHFYANKGNKEIKAVDSKTLKEL
jgi:hypothetical protein